MTTILTRDLRLQQVKGAAHLDSESKAHRHHLDAAGGRTAGCYCSPENYSSLMLVSQYGASPSPAGAYNRQSDIWSRPCQYGLLKLGSVVLMHDQEGIVQYVKI